MSGICGVFDPSLASASEAVVSSMLRRIAHRGPDAASCVAMNSGGVALGQCHLNSFVHDHERPLPAIASANGLAVALAGCVTNRADIPGRSRSDLPVELNQDVAAVMAAYRAHGDACLSHLDGPFALALWDQQEQRLLLSRDKLGEKPLYYYRDSAGGVTIFASEIKAILAHSGIRAELDFDSLPIYFSFGYIPGPNTLFKNIYKLLPGERLCVDQSGAVCKSKYWRLPEIAGGVQDERYCVRRLKELFLRGLEQYVNGCQDVAVFLSGGVDSSIIVAGLRELGVPRIHSFTIGFTVDESNRQISDDLAYARLVAETFSTDHHEIVISPGHTPGPRLLRVVGQFDDLIMTPNAYSKYLLAEAVRAAGLNSVLTGSAAAGACGVHRKFLDPVRRAELEAKTRDCRTDEERYYRLRSRLFKLEEQREFLRQPPHLDKADILGVLHHYIGEIKSDDFFRLFLFSNLMITSTEKTLRVLDQAGMRASVELRSPYLDRQLVEFSAELPSSFDGGKTYVSLKTHLKKAFAEVLPAAVLERPVIGYPSYYWNNGELAEYERSLFNRETIDGNAIFNHDAVMRILEAGRHRRDGKSKGKHSWALTQFALWYEIHINRNHVFTEAAA